MFIRTSIFASLAAIAGLVPLSANALMYDEIIDGDLADDPNAPSMFTLDVGTNLFTGETDTFFGDPDYISFTLTATQVLSSITLVDYSTLLGDPANRSFFGVGSDASWFSAAFTTNPNSGLPEPVASSLVYGNLFGEADIGSDLLGLNPVPPFTGSPINELGEGTWYLWLNETADLANWTIALEVADTAVVPLPAAGWLFLAGCSGLLAARRHRVV